jgi:cytochrome c peroxidase
MTVKSIKLIAIAVAVTGVIAMMLPSGRSFADSGDSLTSTGLGSAETLLARYRQWESESVKNSGEGTLLMPLRPSSTFSTEATDAQGKARINVTDGNVAVEVQRLGQPEDWDVWIVDNLPGPGRSVLPETGDLMIKLGALRHEGDRAVLNMTLDHDALATFDPDLIVITRTGKNPAENRVLSGSLTLFQELYLSKLQGHFGTLNDKDEPVSEEKGFFARLSDRLGLTASAQIRPIPNPTTDAEVLITQGRKIFFDETFQGNGRTCGTCHREEENLTISPQFIATLPIQDPLFVAETQPALSRNFENPYLMRKYALILENIDGFDDLENKFVFRSTQHLLSMLPSTLDRVTVEDPRDPSRYIDGACKGDDAPVERTGWSGDGAPVGLFTLPDGARHTATGTLRDFAIGAIIQHNTRTLARRARTSIDQPLDSFDFRLPTQAELNALEAFQKSLGRREDPNLRTLQLKGAMPSAGQILFSTVGRCEGCHSNAGAGNPPLGIQIGPDSPPIPIPPGLNFNKNTGVENIPDRPTDQNGTPIPRDGGFGERPDGACGLPQTGLCPDGGCGNGKFNSQVLVEAADTGPFFHNNAVNTIEDAVAFYTTAAFGNSPDGIPGPVNLSTEQVLEVAAFLRVLNTLENIRSAGDLENAPNSPPLSRDGN